MMRMIPSGDDINNVSLNNTEVCMNVVVGVVFALVFVGVLIYAKIKRADADATDNFNIHDMKSGGFDSNRDPGDETDKFI